MDVHYLPSNRHIKSAKEYLIDIIIIFIAVTLGFFGNDFRVSYAEKAQAKVYAQSLFDDLKTDSESIQRIYAEKKWLEAKYDSAEIILATKNLYESNEFMYYVERYLSKKTVFASQDITFHQLPFTRNITFIKSIKLTKQIASYYNLCNQYTEIESVHIDDNELSGIESTLFNPRDLASLDNDNATDFYKLVFRPSLRLKPIRRDVESLKVFYIKISNSKEQLKNTKRILGKIRQNGTELMKSLKKEYDLK